MSFLERMARFFHIDKSADSSLQDAVPDQPLTEEELRKQNLARALIELALTSGPFSTRRPLGKVEDITELVDGTMNPGRRDQAPTEFPKP